MLGTGCGRTTIRRSSTPCELANTGGSTKLVASAMLDPHRKVAAKTAGRIDGRRKDRSFGTINAMASLTCLQERGRRVAMGKKRDHRAWKEQSDALVTCYEHDVRFRSAVVCNYS